MSDSDFPWQLDGHMGQSTIGHMSDTIERLRLALEEIASLGEQGMAPNYSEWLTFHDKVAMISREALKRN